MANLPIFYINVSSKSSFASRPKFGDKRSQVNLKKVTPKGFFGRAIKDRLEEKPKFREQKLQDFSPPFPTFFSMFASHPRRRPVPPLSDQNSQQMSMQI